MKQIKANIQSIAPKLHPQVGLQVTYQLRMKMYAQLIIRRQFGFSAEILAQELK